MINRCMYTDRISLNGRGKLNILNMPTGFYGSDRSPVAGDRQELLKKTSRERELPMIET